MRMSDCLRTATRWRRKKRHSFHVASVLLNCRILDASQIQMNHDRQLYEQTHCRQSGNHCSMNDEHSVCDDMESDMFVSRHTEEAYAFTHLHGSVALMC